MNKLNQYTLDEIIDIPSLQNIQNKFSKMTNMSAITVDKTGTPITKPSNFTRFCNLIRTSKEGYRRCINCDAQGGLKSTQLKKPVIYTCHAGLTDLSAPIIVNDIHFGSMLCGQVVIKGNGNKKLIDLEKLSNELSLPVDELEATLLHVKSLKYNKITSSADFLSLCTNSIAKMGVATITHSELLEETKEKMKFQQLAKDAQIKSIQSQLDPHFLFNTLNTIAGMALMENCDQTADLIYSLSDILRYSIKNSKDMVEIGTELENVKKYLFIQTIRYSDKLNYDIEIPDEIFRYKIPAMTLQPIIENAIMHGLEPKKDPGIIKIHGEVLPDKFIQIKITDNGIGMSNEKLNSINNKLSSTSINGGIGIKLVHDRLIYYLGPESGVKIESVPGIGTTVNVKFPLVY